MKEGKKPFASDEIFWDVDTEKLDYQERKLFITERVLTKGTENDEWALYKYYGIEEVKEMIKKVKYLDAITIEYVSELYNIKKEEMFCCTRKQSTMNCLQ